MKRITALCSLLLCTCFFAASAHTAEITLGWDKADGPVAGYRIYYGRSGEEFKTRPKITIDDPDQTSCVISGLEVGGLYGFAATSVDSHGNESAFSEELYHNIADRGETLLDDQWTENEEIDGAAGAKNASGGNPDGVPVPPAEKEEPAEAEEPVETMDASDLSDGYITVEIFDNGQFGTAMSEVVFDGAGGLKYTNLKQSEAAGIAIGSTYTLNADGRLDMEGVDRGSVSPDGSFFVAGKMDSVSSPRMLFGIRKSGGHSAADLSGRYRLFMFSSRPDPGGGATVVSTGTGIITSGGKGSFKKAGGSAFDATYAVNPDSGQLQITPAGAFSEMSGALSPDGGIFSAVDTDSADGTLLFVIGIKGAVNPSTADLAGAYYVNGFEYDETRAPTGSLSEMKVTGNGGYNIDELDNSCDCPPESNSGMLTAGKNGEIQAVDDLTGEPADGGLAPGGEVFTVMTADSLGVGIRQATSDASPLSAPAAKKGGGGGGGGCFIGSLSE